MKSRCHSHQPPSSKFCLYRSWPSLLLCEISQIFIFDNPSRIHAQSWGRLIINNHMHSRIILKIVPPMLQCRSWPAFTEDTQHTLKSKWGTVFYFLLTSVIYRIAVWVQEFLYQFTVGQYVMGGNYIQVGLEALLSFSNEFTLHVSNQLFWRKR